MGRSDDYGVGDTDRQLVDDNDVIHLYSEIKEMLRINFNSFDDLLQKMGKASFQMESLVSFRDFENLVRSMPQASKFSSQQLKSVFMQYASGISAAEASMRSVDFKDKFFPGIHWQRQPVINTSESQTHSIRSVSESEARTESIHVDNILAGLRHDQTLKEKENLLKDKLLKEKEAKY